MQYTTGGVTSSYYFHRNPLGDVVGIYNTSGTLVAKYIYDAWGNCTISGNSAVANANPIRYRGYYYDEDTGLYYCNARYYSPKWRRFISPDSTSYLDPHSPNGLNQYCYCNNDPINYADPSGRGPITALLLYLGAAALTGLLAAGANALGQVVFGGKTFQTMEWGKVTTSGVAGFLAGLIPGTGFVTIAGQAIVSSFVEHGLNAIFLDEEFEIVYVVKDSITSILTGYAMKGLSKLTGKATSKIFHKAPNYSQYQHYFRQNGHNYSVQEVYVHMRRHMLYKGIADTAIETLLDLLFSFSTYPI